VISISDTENGIVCVIPAFNEEVSIGSVVLEARKHCEHVIVVNDGSNDKTSEIARLAGAEIIDMPKNTGKANALLTGLRHAGTNGFKVIVTMDGDGQHDPGQISPLAAPILSGEADLVIGSRFLGSGHQIPTYRKAGQKVLNGLTNAACELEITDSQSGFRALSKTAIANLDFHSKGYNIESDMICNFAERGLRVREIPITAIYDVPNKHKKHPVTHGLSVMGRIINMVTKNRPLLIIGVPGFAITFVGIVLGLTSLFEVTIFGWGWLFQTVVAAFMFILGFVMCICALVLNSLSDLLRGLKNYLERQDVKSQHRSADGRHGKMPAETRNILPQNLPLAQGNIPDIALENTVIKEINN
jgi:glycosyltransferase involved in cell wall biosynthesis